MKKETFTAESEHVSLTYVCHSCIAKYFGMTVNTHRLS